MCENSVDFDMSIFNDSFTDSYFDTRMCAIEVLIGDDVLSRIKQHCRTASPLETMGFFAGYKCTTPKGHILTMIYDIIDGPVDASRVSANISSASRGQYLTTLLNDYPDCAEVGWWHSHPGYGCFFSGTDSANHLRWYDTPHSVALVFDPVNDIMEFFKWDGHRERRLGYVVVDCIDPELIELMEDTDTDTCADSPTDADVCVNDDAECEGCAEYVEDVEDDNCGDTDIESDDQKE